MTATPLTNNNAHWTPEHVALRFDECVSVFNRLPQTVKLHHATYWPDMHFTERELARQEKIPSPPLRPLPDAIDRAEECLRWITWVNHGERNLLWLRAHRRTWRAIARETGFPRTSAQRYWQQALNKIATRLREEGGYPTGR